MQYSRSGSGCLAGYERSTLTYQREKLVRASWDLPSRVSARQTKLMAELLKINHYKAPRDKMICILNCCKVIFGLIRHISGSGPESTSADAFIPILIFVVLRAYPENMISNVE